MLFAILTMIGGLVAASSLIIARTPKSQELFDRIAPYQGILGAGLLGYGVYHLVFRLLPNLSAVGQMPLTMGLVIAGLVLDITIGFLLGYGLVRRLLRSGPGASDRADRALARLVQLQVPMGVGAVAVGGLILFGF